MMLCGCFNGFPFLENETYKFEEVELVICMDFFSADYHC